MTTSAREHRRQHVSTCSPFATCCDAMSHQITTLAEVCLSLSSFFAAPRIHEKNRKRAATWPVRQGNSPHVLVGEGLGCPSSAGGCVPKRFQLRNPTLEPFPLCLGHSVPTALGHALATEGRKLGGNTLAVLALLCCFLGCASVCAEQKAMPAKRMLPWSAFTGGFLQNLSVAPVLVGCTVNRKGMLRVGTMPRKRKWHDGLPSPRVGFVVCCLGMTSFQG